MLIVLHCCSFVKSWDGKKIFEVEESWQRAINDYGSIHHNCFVPDINPNTVGNYNIYSSNTSYVEGIKNSSVSIIDGCSGAYLIYMYIM